MWIRQYSDGLQTRTETVNRSERCEAGAMDQLKVNAREAVE
jgi:hypothetical protein